MSRSLAVAALLCSMLVGCPGRPPTKKQAEPCKQFGQSCEFAPGKLGACSYRTDCPSGENCLYCQSQH
jgi:hypothetical protein